MKASVFIIFALTTVLSVSAWKPKLPKLDKPDYEVSLLWNENIVTHRGHKASFRYKFLDQHLWDMSGSNIRIFGLKSKGNAVNVNLFSPMAEVPPMRFSIDDGKCSLSYLDLSPITQAQLCDVQLHPDYMTWFTLEIGVSYVAVYKMGSRDALVDFSVDDLPDDQSVNFNKYRSYTLTSAEEALWDTQGHSLGDCHPRAPYNPFVIGSLEKMQRDLKFMKEHQWRCAEAKRHKFNDANPDKKKFKRFHSRHCRPYTYDKFDRAVVRQEAIIKANGGSIPQPHEYDLERFFKKWH